MNNSRELTCEAVIFQHKSYSKDLGTVHLQPLLSYLDKMSPVCWLVLMVKTT